jgi:hypothetical protein
MSTLNYEVYAALVEAGASEDKARLAAESLTKTDDQFSRIDTRFSQIDVRLERIEGEQRLLRYMIATVLFGMLGLLAKAFSFI